MKTNPILEEVWRVKDQLAAEAGYDMDRFVEQLREWTTAHPPSGPVVRNAEDLRRLMAAEERQRTTESAMILNDNPPSKSKFWSTEII
jgi:hypothetical protein